MKKIKNQAHSADSGLFGKKAVLGAACFQGNDCISKIKHFSSFGAVYFPADCVQQIR